jgi:uncharacterized protein YecE (DUF72 family)
MPNTFANNVFIGTSGWSYKHWKDRFYPSEIPQRKWLEYYARFFNTVELNASFYRLPSEATVLNWYKRVPPGFSFTIKASRVITHLRKLKDCDDPLNLFYDRFAPLKEKLALIFFQLPPSLHFENVLLEKFLRLLSKNRKHVFEFRHPSWFNEETFELLGRYKSHFCIADYPGRETPVCCVGNCVYWRFHGYGKRYGGEYPVGYLSDVSEKINNWLKRENGFLCISIMMKRDSP